MPRPLQLFRALIPSWRFFDEIAPTPELWVRYPLGEWRRCELGPRGPRSWGRLFLNGSENGALAARSLLRQLLDDVEAGNDRAVSLGLVENLAALHATQAAPSPFFFQFKLTLAGEDCFLSPETQWPR